MQVWIPILQLASSVFEIVGVLLMAHSFMVTSAINIPRLLVSALFRCNMAKGSELLPSQDDRKVVSLQGLSFIALGFMIQAATAILTLFLSSSD